MSVTTPAGHTAPFLAPKRSHHAKPPMGAVAPLPTPEDGTPEAGTLGLVRGRGRPTALAASQCSPEAVCALDVPALAATLKALQTTRGEAAALRAHHVAALEALDQGERVINDAVALVAARLRTSGGADVMRADLEKRQAALAKAQADMLALMAELALPADKQA